MKNKINLFFKIKGWFNCLLYVFIICITIIPFSAQSQFSDLIANKQLDFSVDVYRRKSEYFKLPNFFIRVKNSNRKLLQVQAIIAKDDLTMIELNSKKKSSTHIFLGRNHIKNSFLKYWSHSSPNLYDLRINVSDSLQTHTMASTKIGIVDYRLDNKYLIVNNEKQLFKSVIIKDSTKINEDLMILLKKNHVNTLLLQYVPEINIAKLASKIGMYLIIDLRGRNLNHLERRLVKIKTEPCISFFILENSDHYDFFDFNFPHRPKASHAPVNLKATHLDKKIHLIRELYQPFDLNSKSVCTTELSGFFITIQQTDMRFSKKTHVVYQIREPQTGKIKKWSTNNIRPSPFFKTYSCPLFELNYKITILADSNFAHYNKNDTIASFHQGIVNF